MIERIGDATIYLGDMREICPTLPKADLCVTDPPYELVAGGSKTGEMGGKMSKDKYDNGGQIVECDISWDDFMPVIFDSLAENCHAYIMANNRHVQNCLNSATDVNFKFHNILIWLKDTQTPNKHYMKNCEFSIMFYKGRSFNINDCGAKQVIKSPNERNTDHPTQKPVSLMQYYIEQSSQKGQLVIDPFLGSGTTGQAALRAGRKFIGIEKTQEYFDLSCRNIERELTAKQEVLL